MLTTVLTTVLIAALSRLRRTNDNAHKKNKTKIFACEVLKRTDDASPRH